MPPASKLMKTLSLMSLKGRKSLDGHCDRLDAGECGFQDVYAGVLRGTLSHVIGHVSRIDLEHRTQSTERPFSRDLGLLYNTKIKEISSTYTTHHWVHHRGSDFLLQASTSELCSLWSLFYRVRPNDLHCKVNPPLHPNTVAASTGRITFPGVTYGE